MSKAECQNFPQLGAAKNPSCSTKNLSKNEKLRIFFNNFLMKISGTSLSAENPEEKNRREASKNKKNRIEPKKRQSSKISDSIEKDIGGYVLRKPNIRRKMRILNSLIVPKNVKGGQLGIF